MSGNQNRLPNFEFLRVVAMLAIVAYHAATYSGLMESAYDHPWRIDSAFVIFLGAWGKTGINCFVLVSGYFLCTKRFSWRRLLRLAAEVEFYALAVWVTMAYIGWRPATWQSLISSLMVLVSGVNASFISSFMVLMLIHPLLNMVIGRLSEKMHRWILAVCMLYFVVLSTLGIKCPIGEVPWYCVLYFLAAYLQLHAPCRSPRFWNLALGVALLMSACSMAFGAIANNFMEGRNLICWFVFPHFKVLSLCVAVALFMACRTCRLPSCLGGASVVLGAGTFGVYLLHDGTLGAERVRFWNWVFAGSCLPPGLQLVVAVLVVFFVASLLDFIRRICKKILLGNIWGVQQ